MFNINNKLVITKWFTFLDLGHFVVLFQNSENPQLTFSWCMSYYSDRPAYWWFIQMSSAGVIIDHA